MTSFITIFTLSLYVIAAGIALASFLGYLGQLWWRFELFSHFPLQYAALAFLCGLALLLAGQFPGCLIPLGICLYNILLTYPLLPLFRRHSSAPTYRILTANILGPNGLYGHV
jgi:hypothetical protein